MNVNAIIDSQQPNSQLQMQLIRDQKFEIGTALTRHLSSTTTAK